MRKLKRITSIILATLMVMSLFAAVPMTVNATPPDSSGHGEIGTEIGGSTAVITPTTAGDYLTFTAVEAGSSVTLKYTSGTLQYKNNNSDWASYTFGTQITLASAGDYVRFRGKDTTFNGANHVSIGGKVACSGNVMSLRLNDNGEVQGLSDRCFYCMFTGCTGLTAAPELPETSLARECYRSMFNGCESLTTAPELPATTLAQNCYSDMFYGCRSLTAAPELPATTLAVSCYYNMFSGCRSLTAAPELPATSLAPYCYKSMFNGCGRLTTAPELWATSLAYSCYDSMFKDCTSLTTAPKLWATELESYCYNSMFEGCSSIKLSETRIDKYRIPYIVSSDGNGTADSYARYMFAGTGGSFKGTPELNKTYYMYKDYDYTTTGNNGYYFDDAVEVGSGDALAQANNYTELANFRILGVQKKAEADELSSDDQKDIRFVTVVNSEILNDADDYGYVFAKVSSVDDAREYADMIQADGSKVLKVTCEDTDNKLSGDYGYHDRTTVYKYVTASVNGIGESTVAARFYVRKGDNYYYADYTNAEGTFGVCATTYSELG